MLNGHGHQGIPAPLRLILAEIGHYVKIMFVMFVSVCVLHHQETNT